MQNIYLIPNWFFGLDVIFEFAFFIIAIVVAFYAFKTYKISGQTQLKIFGYSFLFISLSYLIQSFTNFLIISKLNENICNLLNIQTVTSLNILGMYGHIIFFILGLGSLTYMTFNLKSKKTYSLIIIFSLFLVFYSSNIIYTFYLTSSVLLIYIVTHYLTNYLKRKQIKSLLMLLAFVFLLFGSIHFLFAVNHALFYAVGHFFELVAYIFILINLLLILKNGKEKKQT